MLVFGMGSALGTRWLDYINGTWLGLRRRKKKKKRERERERKRSNVLHTKISHHFLHQLNWHVFNDSYLDTFFTLDNVKFVVPIDFLMEKNKIK